MKTAKSIVVALSVLLTAQIASAYYCPSTGRWLSRDPIGEPGFQAIAQPGMHASLPSGRWLNRDSVGEHDGPNIYAFVANTSVNKTDLLGLWATPVHHQIVDDWLPQDPYAKYKWRCCRINVRDLVKQGSDDVDGVFSCGFPSFGWSAAQSSANAYQHGMRDADHNQDEVAAILLFYQFINDNIREGKVLADQARQKGSCRLMEKAVVSLGRAFHSWSDSLSPAHAGFQPWWGPIAGPLNMGLWDYTQYLRDHERQETMQVYQGMSSSVVSSVDYLLKGDLDDILKE